MSDPPDLSLNFQGYLAVNKIACLVQDGTLHVMRSLYMPKTTLRALPDHLHILGSLDISDSAILELPEVLQVDDNLVLDRTRCTSIPRTLSVGGNVSIQEARIRELPQGFHAPVSLDLSGTPIESLPKGLVVGGNLLVQNTKITTFPSDMTVGGFIHPPSSLHDIHTFMQVRNPTQTRLRAPASSHQTLELRAALDGFPDLLRVVLSLPQGIEMGFKFHLSEDGATRHIPFFVYTT